MIYAIVHIKHTFILQSMITYEYGDSPGLIIVFRDETKLRSII